jgi:hypothetical protein
MRKRVVLSIGVVLLVLGLLSLVFPVPTRERRGFEAGPVSLGVEVTRRQKVHPVVSAVMIGGGVLMLVLASRK